MPVSHPSHSQLRPSRLGLGGALLLCASLAPAANQEGDFDRSFNSRNSWNGAPGWAEFQIDPPGRSLHDTATTLTLLLDGTIVVGGLAGLSRTDDNNGLLAAARLNSDGSPSTFWSSGEDVQGGGLPGRITWPHEFDFISYTPAGNNPGGNEGIGFAGSGRVVTGTVINRAKYFSVSPSGTTLNGGLGTCELYAGGSLRNFYALGAATRFYDSAVIAGYVRRNPDQAYLEANCELSRNQTKTQTVPNTLPSSPPGVIGAGQRVPALPHGQQHRLLASPVPQLQQYRRQRCGIVQSSL